MKTDECLGPWRRAVLYDDTNYWYARWYEICVEKKKKVKRIHLHQVMQQKGLFWVTGLNSYCSFLLFCWALPGAAGLLALHHYFSLSVFSSLQLYSSLYLPLQSMFLPQRNVTQGGLMDINRLLPTALEETIRVLSALKLLFKKRRFSSVDKLKAPGCWYSSSDSGKRCISLPKYILYDHCLPTNCINSATPCEICINTVRHPIKLVNSVYTSIYLPLHQCV